MRITPILALTAALALAACDRSKPPEENVENNVEEVINEDLPLINEVATNDANAANVAEPAAPPPAFDDEEQMRDDADATGLTSRLPDDTGEANETQPVE